VLSTCCVVIPTFNERDNLERLARALRSYSPTMKIVVVDDGSPDGTGEIADRLSRELPPLEVLHRRGKGGRGSACLEGFRRALEDPQVRCVVEMDADFSHDPAELPKMIQALSDADVVIRSRYLEDSSIVDWSTARRIFSRWANRVARFLLNIPLTDFTNGYRAYTRAAVEAIEPELIDSKGYIVLSETVFQLHHKGFRLTELPSRFVNRRRGESNLTWREIASAIAGIIRLAIRIPPAHWSKTADAKAA